MDDNFWAKFVHVKGKDNTNNIQGHTCGSEGQGQKCHRHPKGHFLLLFSNAIALKQCFYYNRGTLIPPVQVQDKLILKTKSTYKYQQIKTNPNQCKKSLKCGLDSYSLHRFYI